MKFLNRIILCSCVGIIFIPFFTQADDLLKQAFSEAQDWEYASEEEWDDILGRKSFDLVSWLTWNGRLQWPIISRIAQFMLRMVVVLAIPMILYSAITIMLASWDESKLTEGLKRIWYVVLWVFIALASVMIVLLIISITNTNLWNI